MAVAGLQSRGGKMEASTGGVRLIAEEDNQSKVAAYARNSASVTEIVDVVRVSAKGGDGGFGII